MNRDNKQQGTFEAHFFYVDVSLCFCVFNAFEIVVMFLNMLIVCLKVS